jgi:hypothetical protein
MVIFINITIGCLANITIGVLRELHHRLSFANFTNGDFRELHHRLPSQISPMVVDANFTDGGSADFTR